MHPSGQSEFVTAVSQLTVPFSAERIASSRGSSLKGFFRNAVAPLRKALARISSSACPVTKITGTVLFMARNLV
jgi:hypothetical protein